MKTRTSSARADKIRSSVFKELIYEVDPLSEEES